MAWFKHKTTIATYALFSGILMRLMVVTTCSTCNGSTKDEKIIDVKQYPDLILEGNEAMIFWKYCRANLTSINGFIVFREFSSNQVKKRFLMSIDLNGNVYFTRNKDHILWNRIDLMENDHLISFSIKNVSRNDSGYYRLEIRREGYGDLYSRVQIIVEPSYILMNKHPTTATFIKRPTVKLTANTTKRNENNNTMSQSVIQEHSNTALLWAILAPSVLVIVLLTFGIVILVIYIKKRKEREGQENLISETLSLEIENNKFIPAKFSDQIISHV